MKYEFWCEGFYHQSRSLTSRPFGSQQQPFFLGRELSRSAGCLASFQMGPSLGERHVIRSKAAQTCGNPSEGSGGRRTVWPEEAATE